MSDDATLDEFAESSMSEARKETPIGELPTDWDIEWLSDVTDINPEGFSEEELESDTSEYISLSEASDGELAESQMIPLNEAPSRAQRTVQEGDVLVGTVRPKQRSHGIVTSEYDGNICSSGFGVLRAGPRLNSQYLLQEILSHRFFSQMEAYVAGSGYPAVKIGDLKKHRVAVPPLPEQRKIATVLHTVDRAIEKTREVVTQQKQAKKGLMQDIFQYGIDSDGQVRQDNNSYRSTKYGSAPKGWEVMPLQTLVPDEASITYGIVKPGDHYPNGVPVIKVKDIKNGEVKTKDLLHTDPEIHQKYQRAELQEGDILFTIRGTVGRMAFVPTELEGGNLTQDTARIRVRGANPRFVRYYLETATPHNYFKRHTKGQAVQGINLEGLQSVPVHLPSSEEQRHIVEILDSHTKQIRSERRYYENLKRLKQGLMQDLLSGEVRTTDKSIEVPDEISQHG